MELRGSYVITTAVVDIAEAASAGETHRQVSSPDAGKVLNICEPQFSQP